MRRCFIFAAGSFYGLRARPGPGDLVIAADGGYALCRELGIVPDLLLGDFDSLPQVPEGPRVLRYPVEKDDTDAMLAMKTGLAEGCGAFHLYGGTGGARLDHTLANLYSLLYLRRRGARGWVYGDGFLWTALENEALTVTRERDWALLSLFALDGAAEGVTLTGVQYPLSDGTLTAEFPLGVSNHITADRAEIRVRRGALLAGWQIA